MWNQSAVGQLSWPEWTTVPLAHQAASDCPTAGNSCEGGPSYAMANAPGAGFHGSFPGHQAGNFYAYQTPQNVMAPVQHHLHTTTGYGGGMTGHCHYGSSRHGVAANTCNHTNVQNGYGHNTTRISPHQLLSYESLQTDGYTHNTLQNPYQNPAMWLPNQNNVDNPTNDLDILARGWYNSGISDRQYSFNNNGVHQGNCAIIQRGQHSNSPAYNAVSQNTLEIYPTSSKDTTGPRIEVPFHHFGTPATGLFPRPSIDWNGVANTRTGNVVDNQITGSFGSGIGNKENVGASGAGYVTITNYDSCIGNMENVGMPGGNSVTMLNSGWGFGNKEDVGMLGVGSVTMTNSFVDALANADRSYQVNHPGWDANHNELIGQPLANTSAAGLEKPYEHDNMYVKGNNKYMCALCYKHFTRKANVLRHILTLHSLETPQYACDFGNCKSAFRRKEDLVRHRKIHFSNEVFECPQCDRRFTRKDYIMAHMKKAHLGYLDNKFKQIQV